MKSNTPLVSVIVTTKSSASTIGELLKSIKNQSYQNIETIVVDNNSIDKTLDLSKKYTDKVFQKGPERSAQRNFGVKNSTGEFLLIIDSDMVLNKNVVKECVEKYKSDSKDIGAVVIPEKSFGKGFWAKTKIMERQINQGETFFESARFFPKRIFLKFKGYDEGLTGPEDWDLSQRIGKRYKISRIKSYILHNEGRLFLKTLFKKKFYYGLSAQKYLKKQNLSIISPVTVYFLRPAFYRNWQILIKNPTVALGMILMLIVEFAGGGLGYIIGRVKR